MSEQDRPTPVPLVRLPMTLDPLPDDPGPADYARAYANMCTQFAEIIRHKQHGAAMPRWAFVTLIGTALVACSAFGLAAFALYRLCVMTGRCQ